MSIRHATSADVPAVLPMVEAICAMHQRMDPQRYDMVSDVVDRYRAWLPIRATDPKSVFLVAEAEGAEAARGGPLVGFLIATVEMNIPIYRQVEIGFIHDVWIEPEHRRYGLARQLVMSALARFQLLGIEQVRLETATANAEARELFTKCGFRIGTVDMLCVLESPGGA